VADPTTPSGDGKALEYRFPAGMGQGPNALTGAGPANGTPALAVGGRSPDELYVGVIWKVSPTWQQASHKLGKTFYIRQRNVGGVEDFGHTLIIGATDQPLSAGYTYLFHNPDGTKDVRSYYPNRTDVRMQLGKWYRVEYYFRRASSQGASDGVIRWWVTPLEANDQGFTVGTTYLVGDYANIPMGAQPFTDYWGDPVSGDATAGRARDEYMRFDQIRISGRTW
jgi:hypothetical protein